MDLIGKATLSLHLLVNQSECPGLEVRGFGGAAQNRPYLVAELLEMSLNVGLLLQQELDQRAVASAPAGLGGVGPATAAAAAAVVGVLQPKLQISL